MIIALLVATSNLQAAPFRLLDVVIVKVAGLLVSLFCNVPALKVIENIFSLLPNSSSVPPFSVTGPSVEFTICWPPVPVTRAVPFVLTIKPP